MKNSFNLFLIAATLFCFAACDKTGDLPLYQKGSNPVLTASATAIASAPADSNNTALTLNWTFPKSAADSATTKYVIDIDSSGRNFSKRVSKVVTGALSTTFTAKELNNILLGYGYAFNVPVDMDIRVTSSYANNNEGLSSNFVKIRMTPYKIPPKIALPATGKLYIVGDATDFGWGNPAIMPAAEQLTQLSETKWGGIFHLTGSGGYLVLPLAGNWDNKYSVASGTAADAGDFGYNLPGNFGGGVTGGAGWYNVVLDFQQGKFNVTKVNNALLPDLYVTGDAVTPNWVNNPPANLKFTPVTNGVFEITLKALTPGKGYKFLSSFGNWQPQFGGTSSAGGTFTANYVVGASDPPTIPTPDVAGDYKIRVNFLTQTYTVTKV